MSVCSVDSDIVIVERDDDTEWVVLDNQDVSFDDDDILNWVYESDELLAAMQELVEERDGNFDDVLDLAMSVHCDPLRSLSLAPAAPVSPAKVLSASYQQYFTDSSRERKQLNFDNNDTSQEVPSSPLPTQQAESVKEERDTHMLPQHDTATTSMPEPEPAPRTVKPARKLAKAARRQRDSSHNNTRERAMSPLRSIDTHIDSPAMASPQERARHLRQTGIEERSGRSESSTTPPAIETRMSSGISPPPAATRLELLPCFADMDRQQLVSCALALALVTGQVPPDTSDATSKTSARSGGGRKREKGKTGRREGRGKVRSKQIAAMQLMGSANKHHGQRHGGSRAHQRRGGGKRR